VGQKSPLPTGPPGSATDSRSSLFVCWPVIFDKWTSTHCHVRNWNTKNLKTVKLVKLYWVLKRWNTQNSKKFITVVELFKKIQYFKNSEIQKVQKKIRKFTNSKKRISQIISKIKLEYLKTEFGTENFLIRKFLNSLSIVEVQCKCSLILNSVTLSLCNVMLSSSYL